MESSLKLPFFHFPIFSENNCLHSVEAYMFVLMVQWRDVFMIGGEKYCCLSIRQRILAFSLLYAANYSISCGLFQEIQWHVWNH